MDTFIPYILPCLYIRCGRNLGQENPRISVAPLSLDKHPRPCQVHLRRTVSVWGSSRSSIHCDQLYLKQAQYHIVSLVTGSFPYKMLRKGRYCGISMERSVVLKTFETRIPFSRRRTIRITHRLQKHSQSTENLFPFI